MQTAAVATSGRAAPLYVAVRKALRLGLRLGVLGVLASASASGAGATADGGLRLGKAGLGRHTELADGYFAGSLGHGAGAEAAPGETRAATARSRRGAPGVYRAQLLQSLGRFDLVGPDAELVAGLLDYERELIFETAGASHVEAVEALVAGVPPEIKQKLRAIETQIRAIAETQQDPVATQLLEGVTIGEILASIPKGVDAETILEILRNMVMPEGDPVDPEAALEALAQVLADLEGMSGTRGDSVMAPSPAHTGGLAADGWVNPPATPGSGLDNQLGMPGPEEVLEDPVAAMVGLSAETAEAFDAVAEAAEAEAEAEAAAENEETAPAAAATSAEEPMAAEETDEREHGNGPHDDGWIIKVVAITVAAALVLTSVVAITVVVLRRRRRQRAPRGTMVIGEPIGVNPVIKPYDELPEVPTRTMSASSMHV